MPIEDGWLDTTSGAATEIEPNTDPVSCDSEVPDSSPDPEPSALLPIRSDWAPIMEFPAADILQHSPFGDILNALKCLSLSGEIWTDYGQDGWDADHGIHRRGYLSALALRRHLEFTKVSLFVKRALAGLWPTGLG